MDGDNRPPSETSASARIGHQVTADSDDISLYDLLSRIWRRRWIVCATTVAVVAVVALWMRVSGPLYTASMLVAPAAGTGPASISGALSNYSRIAKLAGIDLPTEEIVTPFTEFTETIVLPVIAEQLRRRQNIAAEIFGGAWHWNPDTGTWTPRGGVVATVKRWLRAAFDLPPLAPPMDTALATYLKNNLSVSTVGTTGMRRIEYQHEDPEFAKRLLALLHREGDALIRKKAEIRASRQIAYIERKLRTVTSAEHRRSLLDLLLEQEKEMMMIQVDLPFAARIISAPAASENPTFPRVGLFIALGAMGGFILGVLLGLAIEGVRSPDGRTAGSEESTSLAGKSDARPKESAPLDAGASAPGAPAAE